MYDDDPREPLDAIDDERLRLIFTCCHPALAVENPRGADAAHGRRSAIELAGNTAEIAYLTRRRDQLG